MSMRVGCLETVSDYIDSRQDANEIKRNHTVDNSNDQRDLKTANVPAQKDPNLRIYKLQRKMKSVECILHKIQVIIDRDLQYSLNKQNYA